LPVDEELDLIGRPVDRVRVEIPEVDRQPDRLEILGDGWIAERVQPHPDSRRPAGFDGIAEHLGHTDLGAAFRAVLQSDHPPGDHRAWRHHGAGTHLEVTVVGRQAPEGPLCLPDDGSVVRRLLADGGPDRAGEVARLDPGHRNGAGCTWGSHLPWSVGMRRWRQES